MGRSYEYVVKRGDTLSRIAKKFNIRSWQRIYNHPLNVNFKILRPNPNRLEVGDVIIVPVTTSYHGISSLITPIQQPSNWTCWAAVSAMLYNWKNKTNHNIATVMQLLDSRHSNPSISYLSRFRNNQGMPGNFFPHLFSVMGLINEPRTNHSISSLATLIDNHGPLRFTVDNAPGTGQNTGMQVHALIIVGIWSDGTIKGTQVEIIDPAVGIKVIQSYADLMRRYEEVVDVDDRLNNPLRFQIAHY